MRIKVRKYKTRILVKAKYTRQIAECIFCGAPCIMGVVYTVRVRNGGWQAPIIAKGKGIRREVGSEGSRRQKYGLRYKNLI